MMSSHPYRQKAPVVPYPVDEFNHASVDSTSNEGSKNSNSKPITMNLSSVGRSNYDSSTPGSNNMSAMSSPLNIGRASAPYSIYGSTPPVLNSREIRSPSSNPLSATSSITNLNLSDQVVDKKVYSKSENNLLNTANLGAKSSSHMRSASSSSSIFYDRSDNISMIDFNQNRLSQYLGNNSSNLLPRMQTIEMYRKNAKKSKDPTVLFQYAQFMLQTALLLDSMSEDNDSSTLEHSQQSLPLGLQSKPQSSNEENLSPSFKANKMKLSSSISFENSENAETTNSKGLKKSLLKEAHYYLKKLSDKGYVDAQYLMADAYSSGAFGKIENREAFILFQSAAKHGHVESAYRASYCFEEGLGTGRDARKAIDYLKMAATKNHPSAMYKLGVYSFYGRMGLSNDMNTKKMGIKWLTRASNISNELIAAAPYELGKIYFDGFEDIIIADKKYGLELYSQAAALGHIKSAAILGKFYEVGEIVPQDSNLSIHYYTQGALGGDAESMLAMCAWYLVGSEPFLPKDESESFEWAKRAALGDFPKAQFTLANFYDKGIGCTRNPSEAQSWYKRAAENGDEKSIARLNDKVLAGKLEKKMKKARKSTKNSPEAPTTANPNQEKDCIIM